MALPDWGIRFARPAAEGGGLPLVDAPVPAELSVALDQNVGFPAVPVVGTGDKVLKGQPIGAASDRGLSVWVHSPSSGQVQCIEPRPVPGGGSSTCIVIETDGQDQPWSDYPANGDPLSVSAENLRSMLTHAGIVGLGGALFPTWHKLIAASQLHTLILNGVECEPHISCDDALMQNEATNIVMGAQIMLRASGAERCLIAIKANSPALEGMQAAVEEAADDRLSINPVAPVYPAGDESQLIRLLTGQEVPLGAVPAEIGLLCQNVATISAVADFVCAGEPLIERIVTIGGRGVNRAVNVRARIGTSIDQLIDCADGYAPDAKRLIVGGPMMGVALPDDGRPLTKACNSLYVAAADELAPARQPMPCIRCGDCAAVCPVTLTPQALLVATTANDSDQLQELGIDACMECGACDYVCPSHIPLTLSFRKAKQMLTAQRFEQQRAELAEQRFVAKEERVEQRAKQQQTELEDPPKSMADAKAALEALLKRKDQ